MSFLDHLASIASHQQTNIKQPIVAAQSHPSPDLGSSIISNLPAFSSRKEEEEQLKVKKESIQDEDGKIKKEDTKKVMRISLKRRKRIGI